MSPSLHLEIQGQILLNMYSAIKAWWGSGHTMVFLDIYSAIIHVFLNIGSGQLRTLSAALIEDDSLYADMIHLR